MIARWGPLMVLVALALGTGWLLRELELEPRPRSDAGATHTPDLHMEDFVSTAMAPSGRPKRRLQADYLEHFPDTDASDLVNPYLILYKAEGQPWHVRSERGWSSAGGEVLLLLGKVHIWRNDAAGARDMDIYTRDLRVIPETEYGETDQPVRIATTTTESRGVGMRAHLAQNRVELLRDVRTVYHRQTTTSGSGTGERTAPARKAEEAEEG
ncbi:MAG: LPS export ABC transporter periplasmic protein LptC [Gammaproteobacteria bacterium]|nr:LPS export ABC transporter periplasmic protein LptC [Gammaproteobacteria bacterium]